MIHFSQNCKLTFNKKGGNKLRMNKLRVIKARVSCVFVTIPYGVPRQVCYWIVSIPDLCLPGVMINRKNDVEKL